SFADDSRTKSARLRMGRRPSIHQGDGMARSVDEVAILSYFETAPLERAELVFKICEDKMRKRLNGRSGDPVTGAQESRAGRRRRGQAGGETVGQDAPAREPGV